MARGKKKTKAKIQQQPAAIPDLSSEIEKVINNSVRAAAVTSTIPPVLMKVCRLCGGKEGPFLNIFDQDQITAIKIDQLMPFRIEENDDLPHKLCFRCSAKLEELHEFVSKCIKIQENLHDTMGKKAPVISKTNTRQMWEEKLNKSNMTNDDICNALIKKAMEGIKDIPLSPSPEPEKEEPIVPKKEIKKGRPGPLSRKIDIKKIEEENNVQLKEVKLALDKCDDTPKRSSRSRAVEKPPETPVEKKVRSSREATKPVIQDSSSSEEDEVQEVKDNVNITDLTFDFVEGPYSNKKKNVEEPRKKNVEEPKKKNVEEPKKVEPPPPLAPPAKPFNIMDHICMIKVNGVGVLFQCKLCNRNFLKREVVQSHSCAKNGVPKADFSKNLLPPEPPKIATVKYINTKVDDVKKVPIKEEPVKPTEVKPKPRIGPASRVKHNKSDTIAKDVIPQQQISEPQILQQQIPQQQIPQHQILQQQIPQQQIPLQQVAPPPVVNFPTMPGLNGRYRLVPGPNNTFTLLEDSSVAANITASVPSSLIINNVASHISNSVVSNNVPSQVANVPPVLSTNKEDNKKSRKRKSNNTAVEQASNRSLLTVGESKLLEPSTRSFIDLIEDEERPVVSVTVRNPVAPQPAKTNHDQPYPVGLFQTIARAPEPPTFTTPAMKKQSYTVVQTGNPSKLLISTKPQAPVEEVPKKRQRKPKVTKQPEKPGQEPFNVTLEDASHPKDPGFFTFINVDPLLQPSYVLPTDNIIQESQISTSTAVGQVASANKEKEKDKDKYSCNMCNETFTREKKLLTHIHSHYSKMDEEDQRRAEKGEPRKRTRKS